MEFELQEVIAGNPLEAEVFEDFTALGLVGLAKLHVASGWAVTLRLAPRFEWSQGAKNNKAGEQSRLP